MKKGICLSDAELKIMDILWSKGPLKARDVAALANPTTGWEKNTVYTMLNRLMKKGAVTRSEPDFTCTAAVEQNEVRSAQTKSLLDKLFSGSAKLFLRAFIHEQDLTKQDIDELKRIIDEEERRRFQ